MRSLFANSLALAVLLLATDAVALKSNAKSSCMSRSEAKAAHRGAYLYWHRNAEGQRCWSTRRVKSAPHAARRAAPVHYKGEKVITDEDAPAPKLLPVIPYQLLFPPVPGAPLPIPPETMRAQSISDWSPWTWTNEAYAATPGPQVLPEPTPVNRETKSDRQQIGRSAVSVDAIMALVAFWLIIFMIGMTSYRWFRQRDHLRIG